MDAEVDYECPRCGNGDVAEVDSAEDGSQEVECSSCGAGLEVTYTVSVEVDGVDVVNAPPLQFECPESGDDLVLDDVLDESGGDEVECDGCGALLEVSWSDWGQQVNVVVLEAGKGEDEEEEEDEEEDEDDEDEWLA